MYYGSRLEKEAISHLAAVADLLFHNNYYFTRPRKKRRLDSITITGSINIVISITATRVCYVLPAMASQPPKRHYFFYDVDNSFAVM